jgi:hypothetical protein
MKKDEFLERYRAWNDEKLVAAFKKCHEYQPEAVEAMIELMKERGMSHLIEKLAYEDRVVELSRIAAADEVRASRQKNYEREMLGDFANAAEYAKKAASPDGIYMACEMASSGSRVWRSILTSGAITCCCLFILSLTIGSVFPYSQAVLGGATFLCGALALYLFATARAHVRFFKRGDGRPVFEISHGNFLFTAVIPITYQASWSMMDIHAKGIRISHPVLCLLIANSQNEHVALLANLTALQDPPPAWPERKPGMIPKGTHFYNELAFHRVDLVRMKTILDGLHELETKKKTSLS